MSKYLVVATKAELSLPWAECEKGNREIIVTGVGGVNVIRALRDLPKDSDILNVGYCGSSSFPIGFTVFVREVRLWHPNVTFDEPTFTLATRGNAICLTAGDFVKEGTGMPDKSVVDMELAYIAALGFRHLESIKFVSDNLNYEQYDKMTHYGSEHSEP